MLLTPEESIQIQVIPSKYLLKAYEGIVLVVSCTPRLVSCQLAYLAFLFPWVCERPVLGA